MSGPATRGRLFLDRADDENSDPLMARPVGPESGGCCAGIGAAGKGNCAGPIAAKKRRSGGGICGRASAQNQH